MRIGICDDEQRELKKLQELIEKYDPGFEILLFMSAEQMINSVSFATCDLILLDIEMDGINGFAAAKVVVKMENPPLVVFVTNSSEYTYRGYEVAFRYLVKPVSYEVLANVLDAAIAKISPKKIEITIDGRLIILQIKDILYFEASSHQLAIHTKTEVLKCRMNLSDIEATLPYNCFAVPHKGYLVNLDFVDALEENVLSIKGGLKIPVSRRRKHSFEQALFNFVRRQH